MKGTYKGLGVLKKTGSKKGDIVDSKDLGEAGFNKLVKKGIIVIDKKTEQNKVVSK